MKILLYVYLWLLVGDILFAVTRWGREDHWLSTRLVALVCWPTRVHWVLLQLLEDWRTDLYHRTKHW